MASAYNTRTIRNIALVGHAGSGKTTLKSLSGGEGVFTMEFDHYETAPAPVQKQLENEFCPTAEA